MKTTEARRSSKSRSRAAASAAPIPAEVEPVEDQTAAIDTLAANDITPAQEPANDSTPPQTAAEPESPYALAVVTPSEIVGPAVVVEPSGATAETLPPPGGVKGVSFAMVYEAVMLRAESMLPDRVVHMADLRMSTDGHLVLPDGARYEINPHAKRQLSSLLGLRWDRWFQSASGEERAEELNRRFARTPGEKKIRAWKEPTGSADGVARAVLVPNFTPIDDSRLFERMSTMLRGLLDEYLFQSVSFTDTTTHYTAVHRDPFDLDGELLHPGWHLRNSEVGASALSVDDHWLRLVCMNGLMVRVGGKRSLYRTHRAIEDDQLAAALVIAIGRLPERWSTSFEWMRAARRIAVPHPDDAVAAVLSDTAEVPRAILEEAQRYVLRVGDTSRFGVVQAITYIAHEHTDDPDVRFAMERLAGDYLAASVPTP